MQILLKGLLLDPLYESATLAEGSDMITYEIIFEGNHVDPTESYKIESTGNGYWTFIGDSGIKHFIRIIKEEKEQWKLKIGFFDGLTPIYDKPNLYFDNDIYRYDKKVLNTYVQALKNDVIPYFFSSLPNETLMLPATDKARYRLYKIIFKRFIDNEKYEIINDDGSKKFTIKQKA